MNPVETQLAGAALDGGPFAAEAAAVAALPQPEALRRLRASAYARFRELGYPSPREEEWRFTNVAPVARTNFERPAPAADPRRRALEVAPFRLEGTREIVFVDGRFAPELSSAEPPAGMRIASFAALAAQGDLGAFAAVLGRKAGFVDQPFLALSTALFEDGLGIEIASGATVAEPLHVIFHSTAAASASASFPRLVILAGENSEATVVESHCGAPGAVYLASAATEIVAAPAARLEHYEFQRESREAFHFATLHVETGRAATVATHSFSLGGAIARHDIRGVLAGEGARRRSTASTWSTAGSWSTPTCASTTWRRAAPATSSTRGSSRANRARCSTAAFTCTRGRRKPTPSRPTATCCSRTTRW